jgi:hypothetical protein
LGKSLRYSGALDSAKQDLTEKPKKLTVINNLTYCTAVRRFVASADGHRPPFGDKARFIFVAKPRKLLTHADTDKTITRAGACTIKLLIQYRSKLECLPLLDTSTQVQPIQVSPFMTPH